MAILDIIDFNAVPTAQQTLTAPGGAIVGAGLISLNTGNSNPQLVRSVEAADNGTRWLDIMAAATSATNARIGFLMPLYPYVIDLTKKFYMGFRFKRFNGSTATAVSFKQLLSFFTPSATYDQLLTHPEIPNWINGSEYYIEVMLDFKNKLYSVWVDGVLLKNNVAMPATMTNTLPGTQPSLALGHYGANTITLSDGTYFRIRDIYVKQVDNPTDDFRLGPQILRRLPLKAVSAPNWVPANGKTLAQSFNDLPAAASEYTDASTFAVSDPNQTPANLTFDLPANLLYPTAVVFDGMGARPAGAAGVIRAKATDGTNTSAEAVKQLTTVISQPMRMLLLTTNLDGSKLTPAGVDNMDLVIQPSIV